MTKNVEDDVDEEERPEKKRTIKLVDRSGNFIGKAIVDYFIPGGSGRQFDREHVAVVIKKRKVEDAEVVQEHLYERVKGIDYRKVDVLIKGE